MVHGDSFAMDVFNNDRNTELNRVSGDISCSRDIWSVFAVELA